MQDVPLSPGIRIKEGSKVVGHIVEVTPASTGKTARISLQFDKLIWGHQTISIATNLRAIAGFMRINEAQTPPIGPGESDVYRWLTTVQITGLIRHMQVQQNNVRVQSASSFKCFPEAGCFTHDFKSRVGLECPSDCGTHYVTIVCN
jgi:hypothetical protein